MTHAEKLNKFAMNLQKIMEERNINPNWRLFSDPDYPRYEQAYQDALKMTNEELEAMETAQAPAETQAPTEAPAAPQVETIALEDAIHAVENYPVDAIKLLFERIAKLEADLATERSYGELARNHADKLTARINKLEADNAAYERIVIQAGKDFEALRNENAELLAVLRMIESLDMLNDAMYELRDTGNMDGYATIYALRENTIKQIPTPPAQEAPEPKFAVGDKVRIVSHIDQLTGKVDAIVTDSFAGVSYRVVRDYSPVTLWHAEGDLEALS